MKKIECVEDERPTADFPSVGHRKDRKGSLGANIYPKASSNSVQNQPRSLQKTTLPLPSGCKFVLLGVSG